MLLLAFVFAVMSVPAVWLGLELAVMFDSIMIMPVPVIIVFVLGCVTLHFAESHYE
jgi:undecaprenyl pyrophosphate phosphatase UppP